MKFTKALMIGTVLCSVYFPHHAESGESKMVFKNPTWNFHNSENTTIEFLSDQEVLYSTDNHTEIINLKNGSHRTIWSAPEDVHVHRSVSLSKNRAAAVFYTHNRSNGEISLAYVNFITGIEKNLSTTNQFADGFRISPRGNKVLFRSLVGTRPVYKVWDISTDSVIDLGPIFNRAAYGFDAVFSEQEDKLLINTYSRQIAFYDLTTKQTNVFDQRFVHSSIFTPDGNAFVLLLEKPVYNNHYDYLQLISTQDFRVLKQVRVPSYIINAHKLVPWSESNRWIEDKLVWVANKMASFQTFAVDFKTESYTVLTPVSEYGNHYELPSRHAQSADGQTIARYCGLEEQNPIRSCSEVLVFKNGRMQSYCPVSAGTRGVYRAALSPDGTTLIAKSWRGDVWVQKIDSNP